MEAKWYKRIGAYLIDIIIVLLLFLIVGYFIPQSENIYSLQTELDFINESFVLHEMNYGIYLERIGNVYADMYRQLMIFNLLGFVITIGYYVFFQFINKGKTFGKQLLKLTVVSVDKTPITLLQLFCRGLIINGMFFAIYSMLLVFILSNSVYFVSVMVVGVIQILAFIISIFMIIYSKKKRGLHDIIGRTEVIEEEVKENEKV